MPGKKISEPERRQQILTAAIKVAGAEGLAGLTVRKIATTAGISTGLVFFHYPTMEILRIALLDLLLEQVLQLDLETIQQRWPTPQAQLLGTFADEFTMAQSLRPEILILLEYWTQSAQHREIRDRLQRALTTYSDTIHVLVMNVMEGQMERDITATAITSTMVRTILGLGLETLLYDTSSEVANQQAVFHALLQAGTHPG